MKAKEIRILSPDEIRQKCEDVRKEHFHLRFQRATEQLDKPTRLGLLRKDVARMKTVLREKEIAAAKDVKK
jgi:large subunit ribosomal protein L29